MMDQLDEIEELKKKLHEANEKKHWWKHEYNHLCKVKDEEIEELRFKVNRLREYINQLEKK